jgi:hypothetical protein
MPRIDARDDTTRQRTAYASSGRSARPEDGRRRLKSKQQPFAAKSLPHSPIQRSPATWGPAGVLGPHIPHPLGLVPSPAHGR